MNVKPGLTSFLKVIILLAGMAILALCIFFVPPMAHFASSLYPNFLPNERSHFHCDVWIGCTFLHCSLSGF